VPAKYDLLILDLDGTLVDSEALLAGLVVETLLATGHSAPAQRAIWAESREILAWVHNE